MLKIKDGVDLSALEKFGFEYQNLILSDHYRYGNDECFLRVGTDEGGIIRIILGQGCLIEVKIDIMNKLYDLIQANLVEKVE